MRSSAPGSRPASHRIWKPLQMPSTGMPCRAARSNGLHHGRLRGDRARAQVVAVGEAARHHDRVDAAQVVVGVPQRDRLGAGIPHRARRVDVVEGAGKGEDADPCGPGLGGQLRRVGHGRDRHVVVSAGASRVTVQVSMTGFASRVPAISSRSASLIDSSTSRSKCLPCRTDGHPGVPDAGERGEDRLALRVEDLRLDDDVDCHAGHGALPAVFMVGRTD